MSSQTRFRLVVSIVVIAFVSVLTAVLFATSVWAGVVGVLVSMQTSISLAGWTAPRRRP